MSTASSAKGFVLERCHLHSLIGAERYRKWLRKGTSIAVDGSNKYLTRFVLGEVADTSIPGGESGGICEGYTSRSLRGGTSQLRREKGHRTRDSMVGVKQNNRPQSPFLKCLQGPNNTSISKSTIW